VADQRIENCLVAIDAADSGSLSETAADLHETLTARRLRVLISRWDASGLFTDFAAAPVEQRDLSPRTLMLLYAADLAFRVRWEIQPALADGQVVIVAPYVSSAIAFGTATGLSHEWLTTLFHFAPTPRRTLILSERTGGVWKRRPERGFGDCCTALLTATPEGFARRKTRSAMVGALSSAAERHGGLYRKRNRRELVEEIVKLGGRRATPTPTRRREH
jgi:thymidylate kinase-like protein